MAKRRLIRGVDVPVELLAEITGRSPATIRRAQSSGPSKRLAQDLKILAASFAPVRRRRSTVPKRVSKKPVSRKPVPSSKKPTPRKPVAAPKKPVPRKPVPRPKKPVSRKPVAAPKKPTPRKPAVSPKKPVPRKPVSRPKKPAPRKPAAAPKKPVPRKPVVLPKKRPRKPVKRKPAPRKPVKYPSFLARAAQAESEILSWLGRLQDVLLMHEPDLDTDVKSFINRDGTVDGELRLRNLPDEWRTVAGMPLLVATLSEGIRAVGAMPKRPPGGFWISFGLRFGPKDQHEIEEMAKFYKRFRGLFQVGAYHTSAEHVSAILNNALAVRDLVERVWAKRDLPPVQLLVRIVWTPDGKRPGRFAGEEGSKE